MRAYRNAVCIARLAAEQRWGTRVPSRAGASPRSLRSVKHGATLADRNPVSATPVRNPRKSHLSADPTPRLQDTVRLSADGLAKVLGDLEARVLRAVWDLGAPAPARVVHERVAADHPVAPLTVITVLNKLVDKQILERHKEHDLLHYSALMNETAFMAHASRRVVEGILSFQPEAVAASMVDVLAERDPERLAELARLIRRRMRESGERADDQQAPPPAPPPARRRGKS